MDLGLPPHFPTEVSEAFLGGKTSTPSPTVLITKTASEIRQICAINSKRGEANYSLPFFSLGFEKKVVGKNSSYSPNGGFSW